MPEGDYEDMTVAEYGQHEFQFWSKSGKEVGIGMAVTFLNKRAAELFIADKSEAAFVKQLAKEVAELGKDVK